MEDSADISNITVQDMLATEAAIDLAENESTSEGFDEEFDNIIQNIDDLQLENIDLHEDLDRDNILQNIKCEHVVTPMQLKSNPISSEIDREKLVRFVKIVSSKLILLRESLNIDPSNVVPVSAQK
ncbi:hypothetical protein DPMN_045933 [Dreissena polymorpha]|uniref:Uncharacterized protein n=1 Tax=Dreissena polymorpha TaxID=45954 RepID=A0A9D4I051_DREPO|nr:hypothetical protein DPMN_045933 [Dreissena polymorpha]